MFAKPILSGQDAQGIRESNPPEANIHRASERIVANLFHLARPDQFAAVFLKPGQPGLYAKLPVAFRGNLPVGQFEIEIGGRHEAVGILWSLALMPIPERWT